jgi:hypothetical protein
MLSPLFFHTITRSWPLWTWRWPWACLSDLNPYTDHSIRLNNSSTQYSSSFFQRQPLPKTFHLTWQWPGYPETFQWEDRRNWQRHFDWPQWISTPAWLVSQWLALSPAQQLAWDANWFWPAAGMDHFMWANAARVMLKGTSSLLTTPPPTVSWLPDCRIVFEETIITPAFDLSGYCLFFPGSDFPDYDDSEECWILSALPRVIKWLSPPPYPYYNLRRRWSNCLYPFPTDPAHVLFPHTFPQQFNLASAGPYPTDLLFEFGLQAHTFLRDGRHGCSTWFFCRPCIT